MTRWLNPAMDQVTDHQTMRMLLQAWEAETQRLPLPAGWWAIEHRTAGVVIGGLALLYLPPGGENLEIGWQLAPRW